MIHAMDERRKPHTVYEIIDVEEVYAFFTPSPEIRDLRKASITRLGHTCIVREAQS